MVVVEVNHVESGDVLKHHFHQPDVMRERVAAAFVVPQSLAGRASRAVVCESPLAKSVTSCPCLTNSSAR